jgi:GrpB-like predicted nucleotidyltransferase (UPF0157 family)
MQVTVRLPDAIAQSMRGPGSRTGDSRALEQLTRELGVELRALHPSTNDPTLRSYYTADVPDDERGARIVDRLRTSPLIAAAYVKPPDAMP